MLLSPIEAPAQAPSERVDAASFILSLRARGIRDTAVLSVMERVRRDLFAPRRFADLARTDVSLPLPFGQTMTAPSTVATMLVALGAEPGHRVLEIGTGSGYVTALLARIGCRITTIERYATLAEEAQVRLEIAGVDPGLEMGVGNGLVLDLGDERFDRILVNGAVASMPSALTSLLAVGGRLVGGLAIESFPRLVTVERGEEGGLATVQGGALRLARLTDGRGALQAAA